MMGSITAQVSSTADPPVENLLQNVAQHTCTLLTAKPLATGNEKAMALWLETLAEGTSV